MIKVVFFDVDGTLLSHSRKEVPESSRAALEKLKEAGIKRVLATGRHMVELERLPIRDIDFDAYILLNGQLCLDGRKEVFYKNPIIGQEKEHILKIFHEKIMPIVLVEKDRMYINYIDDQVRMAQIAISTPLPKIGEYQDGEIYLAVAYVAKEEEQNMKEQLPNCNITRWNEFGMDIGSKNSGKVAGIQEFLNQNHILLEETMAFGDGENDIEMLKFVHTGVAMGNAEEPVKDSADYTTAHIDEDGVEKALRYFGVI